MVTKDILKTCGNENLSVGDSLILTYEIIQVFIQTNLLSVVYGTVMEIHLLDLCQKPFMTKRDMI